MTQLKIDLRTPDVADAPALFALIQQDRTHLARWLPWAATTQSVADERIFLRYCQGRIADKQLWLAVIWVDDQPAGMIDLHNFQDRHADVGYWLGRDFRGQGVISRSLAQVETVGFDQLNLVKLNILAATANHPSRQVAERNHYHLDGILRQHIPVTTGFADAAIYSKLATEQ
ncbi:GNAT family N-acetyltransferase [Levilactobacillus suantsaiihabitans]|uniref:N-acetyltransferase n=1 Tax=Levilactobacillus suantsaiihabitans TaxID=2487722 RepID=A0A4Z0JAH9_9LACO|nr:GNAT family protein [Levilactobacillus suantsaiihabitans]TGD19776.1 N-acetyltransferase [Levilactobacillus suantsaiihabitans]